MKLIPSIYFKEVPSDSTDEYLIGLEYDGLELEGRGSTVSAAVTDVLTQLEYEGL